MKAYEIIFLDLGDVIVLEVDDHCVFSDLLGDRDLTCLVKETRDYRVWGEQGCYISNLNISFIVTQYALSGGSCATNQEALSSSILE